MSVFVVGMHRSGTSTLVRLLEAAGFDAGSEHDFQPPTEHDPEGHREHIAMWSANEAALAAAGFSWDQPVGLDWTTVADDALRAALDAVGRGWDTIGSLGVAKDPRLCLTLPLWRRFAQPACLMVHREPLEVAASLQSRDGWPLIAGVALWEAYLRAAIRGSDGLPRVWVDFAALSEQPEHSMATAVRSLCDVGVDAPPGAPDVRAFRSSSVRHRADSDQRAEFMNAGQIRLLGAVRAALDGRPEATDALEAAAAEPLTPLAADTLRVLAADRRRVAGLHRAIAEDRATVEWLHGVVAEDRATIAWLHREVAAAHAAQHDADVTATPDEPAR